MTLTTLTTAGTGTSVLRGLSLTTALAGAVTGGTLFAFSTFVLPGLRRLAAPDAVAAMQAINLQAPRSLLMLPLLGSALGSVVVAVLAVAQSGTPNRGWLLVGAAAGVVAFVITAAYHVPHNDALALLDPHAADTPGRWAQYAAGWARWNHVRTLAALTSAVALVTGVVRHSG